MRSTKAGVGAILTEAEKRQGLKKKLDGELTDDGDTKPNPNEVFEGEAIARTASGKTKA